MLATRCIFGFQIHMEKWKNAMKQKNKKKEKYFFFGYALQSL